MDSLTYHPQSLQYSLGIGKIFFSCVTNLALEIQNKIFTGHFSHAHTKGPYRCNISDFRQPPCWTMARQIQGKIHTGQPNYSHSKMWSARILTHSFKHMINSRSVFIVGNWTVAFSEYVVVCR